MTTFLKNFKMPHAIALLTILILICSLLSYIIPSGKYEQKIIEVGTTQRTILVPGTFKYIPKSYTLKGLILGDTQPGTASPVSLVGFISAIPKGMQEAADIIFFIFIVGGVFGILTKTGTIIATLQYLLDSFGHSGILLTIVLMIIIGICGSTIGVGEELIPLVPVFLIVSNKLGYDRIFGFCLVYLASMMGFAAATTNPFTVQIAQGIAGVPINSGMSLRIVFFICAMTLTIIYVLRYGTKTKKDNTLSVLGKEGFSIDHQKIEKINLKSSHIWIIICSVLIFSFIIYASQSLGWWLTEMAGGFIFMGFVAMFISRLSLTDATNAFIEGMKDMVVAALIVGFAKGIQVVLTEAQIIDTLIYYTASALQNYPRYIAAEGMLLFQTVLNFFIPSGSGQAAVTMPLMAPLSDILGISRQTAVFAFTCGDGFSNTIIPTSGLLLAMLSMAKVPYEKWFKFMLPLFIQLIILAGIFMAIAVWIKY